MKQYCFYRDNSYFNDKDYYLMYYPSLNKLYLNKCETDGKGGTWYSAYCKALDFKTHKWYNRASTQFKMTSIPCINFNELDGLKVLYKGTLLTGHLGHHSILNFMGVQWDAQASKFKEYGFPPFWADPNWLETQHNWCQPEKIQKLPSNWSI